ncbi:hypothetical protein SAMN06265353_0454 [Hydrogenobacter hydrogenophilus]|uniref:Uncharacterized protein n=1 Tax=Hydrogenobacter hydrogenophilus TaxID=35835 RepID=A0A285NRK3_9AQUI|nr:hypothetical protein SAMN06265353_0454 [Hydrogenobacter hydrogenophilus]
MVIVLLLFACASMTKKLDPKARVLYSEGYQGERDFKVLLQDADCQDEIKKRYKVKVIQGKVMVLTLTHSQLESLLSNDCVVYISPVQKLEFK